VAAKPGALAAQSMDATRALSRWAYRDHPGVPDPAPDWNIAECPWQLGKLPSITPRLVRRYVKDQRLKAHRQPDGSYAIWLRDLQAFAQLPRPRGRPWSGAAGGLGRGGDGGREGGEVGWND
jgi:hypothetical protein